MAQKLDSDKTDMVGSAGSEKSVSLADNTLGENHPLAKLAGSYKDDPFWNEFLQAMREAREAEDRHLVQE